jgi:hypothetical protein
MIQNGSRSPLGKRTKTQCLTDTNACLTPSWRQVVLLDIGQTLACDPWKMKLFENVHLDLNVDGDSFEEGGDFSSREG